MTKQEAVLRASALISGKCEADRLLRYINQLDMRAQIDILGIDAGKCGTDGTELALPSPYDEAYAYYAAAQVNFEREEYKLYNNLYDRAQELYSAYARYYNRKREPVKYKVTGLW